MVIEWQQVLHCCLFWAMSCKVLSHWWEESRGPQPGKRQAPATAKSFVIFFIFDCHVSCWPPRDFFQLDPRVVNITFCVKRFSSIRRTWPSHRRRACCLISVTLLLCQSIWKTFDSPRGWLSSASNRYVLWSLDIMWSKTCSRWRSSERIGHVLQPCMSVGRTVH